MRAFLIAVVLTSGTVLAIAAQGNPDAAKLKNPVAATPESLAAGKQVYQRYCAVCHGINATGGSGSDISPPAPDLTTSTLKHGSSDGEIFFVIKNGVPPDLNMEPWGERIKENDIWNVVNYLRSLTKR